MAHHARQLRASISLTVGAFLLTSGVALGGGGTTTVEAGAYFDFAAPDPITPAPGSITFGFAGTPEEIAADAVLVPPADTNLAFFGGGTPTCLEVTREGGSITQLAFAAECTVDGMVTFVPDAFGPSVGAYLIGDRVAAPQDLVEGNPAFATMIGVPAASGASLAVTFEVDLASGAPLTFVGVTEVVGVVTMMGSGDVTVGSATLPDAVIDDASRALLAEAAALGIEATVGIVGTGIIEPTGDPSLEVALSVTAAAPIAVPTSAVTPAPTRAPIADALPDTGTGSSTMQSGGLRGVALALGLLTTALASTTLATRRRRMS